MTTAEPAFTSNNMIESDSSKPFDTIIYKMNASYRQVRNVWLSDSSNSLHGANHLSEQARWDRPAVEANNMIYLGL